MFLRIVPVGSIQHSILDVVRTNFENNLNIKCRIMSKLPIPEESFNRWRKQYNAEVILASLSKDSTVKFIDRSIPTLMIIDADLYYGGLNFVFGVEDPSTSSSIVSIARLRPEFYDERANTRLLEERVVKEAMHEMGHHLGLRHCINTECVMCFSPSVGDIDIKQKYFCESCKVNLMARGISL